jgi:hypothetical protein
MGPSLEPVHGRRRRSFPPRGGGGERLGPAAAAEGGGSPGPQHTPRHSASLRVTPSHSQHTPSHSESLPTHSESLRVTQSRSEFFRVLRRSLCTARGRAAAARTEDRPSRMRGPHCNSRRDGEGGKGRPAPQGEGAACTAGGEGRPPGSDQAPCGGCEPEPAGMTRIATRTRAMAGRARDPDRVGPDCGSPPPGRACGACDPCSPPAGPPSPSPSCRRGRLAGTRAMSAAGAAAAGSGSRSPPRPRAARRAAREHLTAAHRGGGGAITQRFK